MKEITASIDQLAIISTQMIELAVQYSFNIFAGLGTLIIGLWLSGRASKAVSGLLNRMPRKDATLTPVAAAVAKYAVIVITIIITLSQFGVETTSVIAVLGAAGLAIGLALQGTLSNVAAGVMLLILRPFEAGNWVETNGFSGTVKEIGLFTTSIITFENVFISIPNSSIWSATIINHNKISSRRLDLDIGVGYDTDLDVAEKALLSLARDSRVLDDPAPVFLVVSYDDSAITVRLRLYANFDDFFALSWDLNRQLKSVLDAHNIDIPFPQRVVHHKGATDEGAI